MTGVRSGFKALAVGLCLLALQPAFAVDKKRSLYAKRWYTVADLKETLRQHYPSHYDRAFHKSVTWVFAEDGFFTPGSTRYIKLPLSKPIIESDNNWWRVADKGKDLSAEIDQRCVLALTRALGRLKDQASRELRWTDAKEGVIDGVRSGVLSTAPLDLSRRKDQKIGMIKPEGDFRLLCNVYKSTKKDPDLFFQYSVVLTATSVYGKLP